MKAKQLLRNIRTIRIEVKALEEKREELESRAVRITRDIEGVPGSSGKKRDLSNSVVGLLELDSKLRDRIESMTEQEKKALDLISGISNPTFRTILTLYYISGNDPITWDDVAEKMNYSLSAVCHYHGHALQELQKIMDEKSADICNEQ